MIKIALLLLLFLVYVYASVQQEGLRNYNPLTEVDPVTKKKNIYGVNVNQEDPDNIYNLLVTPGKELYDQAKDEERTRYKNMTRSDVFLDMQYFNNASYLIFQIAG